MFSRSAFCFKPSPIVSQSQWRSVTSYCCCNGTLDEGLVIGQSKNIDDYLDDDDDNCGDDDDDKDDDCVRHLSQVELHQ